MPARHSPSYFRPDTTLMTITNFARSLSLVATLLVAGACADSSFTTAPVNTAALSQSSAGAAKVNGGGSIPGTTTSALTTTTAVNVLTRTRSIAEMNVSQVIGAAGGSITIAGAGFTLIVPANAVSSATTFRVRALAGKAVAYEFEPHGTTFNTPLIFKQDLTKTSMSGTSFALVEGAYFASAAQVDLAANTAQVDQFFSTWIALDGELYIGIPHFSGYLVSSGRR